MGNNMEPLWQILASNGVAVAVSGVFVWLVYHVTTKALPDLLSAMREDLVRQRTDFIDALARHRTDSETAAQVQRDRAIEILREMRESFAATAASQQKVYESTVVRIEMYWAETVKGLIAQIGRLCDQVDRLATRVDESAERDEAKRKT